MEDFLKWITGPEGGGLLLVMWAVSWQLEKMAFWTKLSSGVKQLIILVSALVLAGLGVFLRANPQIIALFDPYFKAFQFTIMIWLTSQVSHKADKLITAIQLK